MVLFPEPPFSFPMTITCGTPADFTAVLSMATPCQYQNEEVEPMLKRCGFRKLGGYGDVARGEAGGRQRGLESDPRRSARPGTAENHRSRSSSRPPTPKAVEPERTPDWVRRHIPMAG